MRKEYRTPAMYYEAFTANSCVAACGDVEETKEFQCFRGSQNDTANVFAQSQVCRQIPLYYSGVTTVRSSERSVTYNNASGVYAYCTKRDGTGYYTGEWEQDGSILSHKKNNRNNRNKDTHGMDYHCMAVAVYGNVEEFQNS